MKPSPVLGQQIHDQHQHRDELLAGRSLQPLRMPPAPVRHDPGHLRDRRQDGQGVLRRGGWVAHHNIDLWRGTAPVDAARFGMWPVGGAWLCQHLWEHYAFSGDQQFLKEYYPVMKGFGPVPAGTAGRGAQAPLAGHAVLHVAGAWLSRRQRQARLPLARTDHGRCHHPRVVPALHRGQQTAGRGRGFPRQAGSRAQEASTVPDQPSGLSPGMDRRLAAGDKGTTSRPISPSYPGSSITLRGNPRLAAAIQQWMETRHAAAAGRPPGTSPCGPGWSGATRSPH